MKRREFLQGVAATGALAGPLAGGLQADEHADHDHEHCHPTYASIKDAMTAPPEQFAFMPAIMVGTNSKHPDYLATVDVNPSSQRLWQSRRSVFDAKRR